MKRFTILLLAGFLLGACSTPAEKAASQLAGRIVPAYKIQFKEVKDSVERYRFYSRKGRLVIEGTGPGAMAVGLNHYLNAYCATTVSWYADEPVTVPQCQPEVAEAVQGAALVPERFFLNYCTFGYAMPWWQWADWERCIDWMALQGVNLPLAITGQDAVWQEVWRQHSMSDEEIRAWFTGPAHLPWHRMCNIDGVDGPLPQGWIDGQKELQKRIVRRERDLGMKPVLPAFAGHVPVQLKSIYPDAQITDITHWGGFPQQDLPHFLSPEDSLYPIIQRQFLEAQTLLYGSDHIYGFDLFNEVDSPSWDPQTLARIGRKAYESVAEVDPEAQWLQMGWMFYYDRKHWTPENVKAYLQAVPEGKVTLLDYYTENTPVWPMTESFYGQPYIFCYLGNFGGNTRLAGPFRKESARISEALAEGGDNLQGIGCTLEGFGLNRWMYEYVLHRAWDDGLDDAAWLAQLERRQGCPEGLWRALADSVYVRGSFSEGPLVCGRPCEEGYDHWTVIYQTPYDNATLVRAWRQLPGNVDWGSQALGNHFAVLRDAFVAACHAGNSDEAERLSGDMRTLLADIAALTACDPHSRLDRWLSDAEGWAVNEEEKSYYRHNAWLLLTLWGENSRLNDYANRQWSGLVDHYYAKRWELFIDEELACLKEGRAFDQQEFNRKCAALEKSIVDAAPMLEDRPATDAKTLAKKLLHRWFPEEKTLLSYNVGAFGKYPESSIEAIAPLIAQSSFAAVQETDSCNRRHNNFQVKDLADAAGGLAYHFASAFPFADGAYGNGVLSQEPVLAHFSIPLPQGDGSEPRSVAVIETASCVFASVHLDYKSKAAAQEQARVLNAWFSEHYAGCDKPVFLCGDMNALPDSPVIFELCKSWYPLSGIDTPTHADKCIDYIFAFRDAAPVKVLSSQVLTDIRLSDHYPLRVRVRF